MDQQSQYVTFIATIEGICLATVTQRMNTQLHQVKLLHQCHAPGPSIYAYTGKPETDTILIHSEVPEFIITWSQE